jgi:PAS domain S-box-containing protein
VSLLTLIDLAGLAAQLTAFILIIASMARLREKKYLFLLLVISFFLLFNNVSNTLQWAGVTEALDPFEDHLEILSTVLWGFFLAAFIQFSTEKALASSENWYRLLFQAANDAIFVHNYSRESLMEPVKEANDVAERMYGYTREELLRMAPQDFDAGDFHDRVDEVLAEMDETGRCVFERTHITREGNRFPVEVSSHLFNFEKQPMIMSVVRDLSKRRSAEMKVRQSLQEKETLLREVHHRVKNNLQVISGLLNLQSMYIDEQESKDIYKESQNRIKTMALIHEELYQRDDLARIDFAEYISNLLANLFASYSVNRERVSLELDLKSASMVLDTAIPCGLIVNELVTNSLKHAFADGMAGEVGVAFSGSSEAGYQLRVWDSGSGMPDDLDFRRTRSMGLKLVAILTEQLDAGVTLDRDGGTAFTITFQEYREADPEQVY